MTTISNIYAGSSTDTTSNNISFTDTISSIYCYGASGTIDGNGSVESPYNSDKLYINNMVTTKEIMTQAKIAIFEITRDEKGLINSSKFKVEFWMEKKKGASIELAAAKYLSEDFDPDLIIVKELCCVFF